MKFNFRTSLLVLGLFAGSVPLTTISATGPDDVIAKVGDEIITFNSLDVTINSSAMVGIPIPKPGTRERTNMRLTLLDRRISSGLLYLDAMSQKLDQNPVFVSDVQDYADTILGMMYKQKYLVGELPVSDDEIREYFKKNYPSDVAFTSDLHAAIEAVLRKQQFKGKLSTLRDRLRQGVDVKIYGDKLDAAGDADRKSSVVVADVDGESLTWGKVRQTVTATGKANLPSARHERLEKFIDSRLMVKKAKAAGLEKDEGFQRRIKEFKKSGLINMNRALVTEKLEPTDEEVRAYFDSNRDKIEIRERRKIQMVVVKTKEEASEIKQKLVDNEITFYQAASDYSIDPNAKKNLGELGWVTKGTGFEELDKATFALQPNEIGGPVETPAGWHLVRVVEVSDGEFGDIEDRATWKKARRLLLRQKENDYVANLRETKYQVEVYDDVFNRLTQQEVDAQTASQK